MSKAVLISIQPKWCELIASGKKTVEVRKSKPNLDPPFKVYIYCTKAPKGWVHIGKNLQLDTKVIGEFTCSLITPIAYTTDGLADVVDCETACMKPLEFLAYGKSNPLYAWHISSLAIYGKPKELSELRAICRHYDDGLCGDCEYYYYANNESYRCEECLVDGLKPITRPPQSWCYVEEVENDRARKID